MTTQQEQPKTGQVDVELLDGSILRNVIPQFDGEMWWEGAGIGERFIAPGYFTVVEQPPVERPTAEDIERCGEVCVMFEEHARSIGSGPPDCRALAARFRSEASSLRRLIEWTKAGKR